MKKLEGLALFQARESLVKMQSLCCNLLVRGCKSYAQAVTLRDLVAQFRVFESFPTECLASLDCWFVRAAQPMTEKEQKQVVACGLPHRDAKLVIFGLSDTGKQELLIISAWIKKQIAMADARRQAERQDSLQFASEFLREKGFKVSAIPKSPVVGIRGDKESIRVEIFNLLGAEVRSWPFVQDRWSGYADCWYWIVRCWNPNPIPFGPKVYYGGNLDYGNAHADLDARGLERAFGVAVMSFERTKEC